MWVKFAGLFSAYDLLLVPGINQLSQLIVCKVYKVNNHLQMFEKKTLQIKNIMHGLHNIFYF